MLNKILLSLTALTGLTTILLGLFLPWILPNFGFIDTLVSTITLICVGVLLTAFSIDLIQTNKPKNK